MPLRSVLLFGAIFGFVQLGVADEVRFACWNLEWFFDNDTSDDNSSIGPTLSAPDATKYKERVSEFAKAIAALGPIVISLEEIENEKVIKDIADELDSVHHKKYKVSFDQGNDTYTGQDVAFLVADGIPFTHKRLDFTPYQGNSSYKDLSKHQALFTTIGGETFVFVAVHMITTDSQRIKQAKTLREWISDLGELGADTNIIVMGDYNTHIPFGNAPNHSDMWIIQGKATASTNDDMIDYTLNLPAPHETHTSGQVLDRVVISQNLADTQGAYVTGIQALKSVAIKGSVDSGSGVRYDLPVDQRDLSDHYPVLVTMEVPSSSPGGPGPHLALAPAAPGPAPTAVAVAPAPQATAQPTNEDLLQAIKDLSDEVKQLRTEVDELKNGQ